MNAFRLLLAAGLASGIGATISAGAPADATFSNPRHFLPRDGKVLFEDICAACHMPDGEGAKGAGAYPALARNPKLAASSYPVFMVVNGRAAMPSFARWLDDDQIAAVVNYVREHFGNAYHDRVTAVDVRAARSPVNPGRSPLE